MNKVACSHCGHDIDALARLCPFCGADPETGRKADTARIVQSHFPRKKTDQGGRARDFLRARQGIVLTFLILVVALLAIGVHQMIINRNINQSGDAPAIPLTELTDISSRAREAGAVPMPELEFAAEGDPRRVRTLLLEPGAVAPTPEPTPPEDPPQAGGLQPGQPAARPRQGPPAALPGAAPRNTPAGQQR